jgi:hypothetical protein
VNRGRDAPTRALAFASAVALGALPARRGADAGEPEPPAYREVAPDAARATGSVAGVCRAAAGIEAPVLDAWPAMGAERAAPSPRVAIGEGRALGGCVVRIPALREGKPWPEAMRREERVAWIEARDGAFVPAVQWVRPGTHLGFRSRLSGDLPVHGYRGAFDRTQFNFLVGPGREVKAAAAVLEAPGLHFATDDGRHHFWAHVFVAENPYVAVTSAEASEGLGAGAYRIEGVPPGDHEVVGWHAGMRLAAAPGRGGGAYRWSGDVVVRRRVRVRAGETSFVDLDYADPPPSPSGGREGGGATPR